MTIENPKMPNEIQLLMRKVRYYSDPDPDVKKKIIVRYIGDQITAFGAHIPFFLVWVDSEIKLAYVDTDNRVFDDDDPADFVEMVRNAE